MGAFDRIVSHYEAFAEIVMGAFYEVLRSPLRSYERVYWVYVLSSAGIVLALYALARWRIHRAGEEPEPSEGGLFRFFFPRSVWKQPSAWLDVRYYFLNQTVKHMLFPLLQFVSFTGIAIQTRALVSGAFETPPLAGVGLTPGLAVVSTIALFALLDFTAYAVHVLQHKIPWLWEFHKIHHSAPVMHPLTNYREHPVDNILNMWANAAVNGIGVGIVLALFDEHRLVKVLGITFLAVLYNALAYHLRHSHVWLAWPPSLGWIFGSPANHQIHHSAEIRHRDRNFGFAFAIWDWAFGTLYLPRERESFRLGLGDGSEPEYSNSLRLYFLPFAKLFRSAARRLGFGGPTS